MAALSSTDLLSTWRALSGDASSPGWRTIDLFQKNTVKVKAARHAPGNEETVLIGFSETKIAPTSQLPQGQGFRIERVNLGETLGEHQWLAIIRQPAGSLELFAAVVVDVCTRLSAAIENSEHAAYQTLLGRVRGWQEFMRRGRAGLTLEAEQGLVGELLFLRKLLDEGLPFFSAINGWKGPLDGLHDFELGTGAIEVKSTMATQGFPVRIASLEQLDDAQSPPLFIAALRLTLNEHGTTLPSLVAELRGIFMADFSATGLFEHLLHQVGYLDMHASTYIRIFSVSEIRLHQVDESFPRLIRTSVHTAIRQAQYDLDLALTPTDNYPLTDVLEQLGVI
ncbi:hypothetical protein AUC61_07675 [Pseudomonas sp. S25]|uniref:PD-(D/E)XK family member n=1 Tax=Pseudomonas maioricensis TaxID=1766623 RepID=A0ABS9ZG51_9PSED|nr:PD-(D/E)XK motif protein [Pseudomonas sp. S25]MCI8209412.1 hypothetical protein [Pseudomonas sp. S25]